MEDEQCCFKCRLCNSRIPKGAGFCSDLCRESYKKIMDILDYDERVEKKGEKEVS